MYRPRLEKVVNRYPSRIIGERNIRRGVVVFEEVEVSASRVLHLEGDGLAARTREGGNDI